MVCGAGGRPRGSMAPSPAVGSRPNDVPARLATGLHIAAAFCRPPVEVGGSGGRAAPGNLALRVAHLPMPDLLGLLRTYPLMWVLMPGDSTTATPRGKRASSLPRLA